jgi:hypothetical protein
VPLGLRAAGSPRTRALLPGALCLALAQLLQPGLAAAALALPWIVAVLLQLGRAPGLPILYALVGAGWALFDRAGLRPLHFDPVIVLLTAVHFHYAGFALPLATRLAARERPGRWARSAVVGTLLGPPLVAVGITGTSLGWALEVEAVCAILMAAAAGLAGLLHLAVAARPAARVRAAPLAAVARALLAVAGLSLLAGALLAALYGLRFHLELAWLDVPWMWALHGSLNGLGFALAGLSGWRLVTTAARRPCAPAR